MAWRVLLLMASHSLQCAPENLPRSRYNRAVRFCLEVRPMKPAILLAIAIVILSSFPVASRHDDAVAQESASMHGVAATDRAQARPSSASQGNGGFTAVDADHCAALQKRLAKREPDAPRASEPVVARNAASSATCVSAEKANSALQTVHARTLALKPSSLASSQ
jgi:hypothetical protein